MAEVFQLREATRGAADDLARLGSILHGDKRTTSVAELKKIVDDENIALVIVRDGSRLVGMGTLYIIPKVGKRNAYIEDVIVDETYRGQGLGGKIMEELLAIAKERGVSSITLTSRSHRTAAHGLYTKLGFKTVETNVFKLSL